MVKKLGNMMTGTASVQINKGRSGKFALVSYLPAGIDLTPMVHGWFESLDDALAKFAEAVQWTEKIMGLS
jgi:hypothetical protein